MSMAAHSRSFSYVASTGIRYDLSDVARATLRGMRSTPAVDAELQELLAIAVKRFAGGSVDAFARLIGYETNGGYLREILSGKKQVRDAIIQRVHGTAGMEEWFMPALNKLTSHRPEEFLPSYGSGSSWPFEDVERERFERLTERQKGRVERAMLLELDAIEAEQSGKRAAGGG